MEKFTNNASTTLNGAINNSTTSVVVTSATGFPTSGDFRIVVDNEIMLVTAVSGSTFTVTRGSEGSTAASHADLTPVKHVYTKGSIERLLSDYEQSGGYASRPASPYKGTVYTANDVDAKWLYDGTNWNLIHPYCVPYAKRADFSGWTALNQGSNTFTDVNGIMYASITSTSGSGRGFYKTIPTAPFKSTILVPPLHSGQRTQIGLAFRENSTGKLRVFFCLSDTPGKLTYEFWTNENSPTSVISGTRIASCTGPTWLRIEDDNTNWRLYTSRDGKNYTRYFSETRNTGFTADKIAILWYNSVSYSTTGIGLPMPSYWEE
jgi:hypothetical protein